MEQQDKERLFVLLGDIILVVINLISLTIALAYECEILAVFISYFVSLTCLMLSCTIASTVGGKPGLLSLSKIPSWIGTLGLTAAGIMIIAASIIEK